MRTIRAGIDRKSYWDRFWSDVGRDPDHISSTDVYPLYPTDRHVAPGARILELGCGMGRVVKHYTGAGRRVVGMDYEPRAIARLKRERPELPLYVGDATSLPHPSGAFDVVLAFGTLSNLPDPSKALDEAHRALKPGGILVASVTLDSLPRRVLSHVQELANGHGEFAMVAYTAGEWRRLLAEHGFDPIEMTPIVTRLPIYTFFPFLRSSANPHLVWSVARDGDRGLALNPAGEWVFRNAFRWFPWFVSHGAVGVGRKAAA
jgi:SAM-dependent methyltransferase